MDPDSTLSAIRLSLQVSAVATVLVLVPGALAGYLLARREFPGKRALSAALALPLVLPPTAVGCVLLSLLAAGGPLGRRTLGLDLGLLLTWKGAVAAAAVMALPLVVGTARVAFEGVDPRLAAMARTLGHGRVGAFLRVTLPLAARGLVAAAVLGFGRALSEFGATLIVAGNIPGRTRTLPLAIFSAQQAGRERDFWLLIAVSTAVGFAVVYSAETLAGRRRGGGER